MSGFLDKRDIIRGALVVVGLAALVGAAMVGYVLWIVYQLPH